MPSRIYLFPFMAQLLPVLTQELPSWMMAKPAAPVGCKTLPSKSGVDQLTIVGLAGGTSVDQHVGMIGQCKSFATVRFQNTWSGRWGKGCFPKRSGCLIGKANECWPGTHKGYGVTTLQSLINSPPHLGDWLVTLIASIFLHIYIII